MASSQRFQVGDRVRTIRRTTLWPKGMNGIIERVYNGAELYAVRFEGLREQHAVLSNDLTPATSPHHNSLLFEA
jgi:hypothetical protein